MTSPSLPAFLCAASFPMLDGPQRAAAPGRHKVVLPPGHTQMDWLRLTNSGADLRVRPASSERHRLESM